MRMHKLSSLHRLQTTFSSHYKLHKRAASQPQANYKLKTIYIENDTKKNQTIVKKSSSSFLSDKK